MIRRLSITLALCLLAACQSPAINEPPTPAPLPAPAKESPAPQEPAPAKEAPAPPAAPVDQLKASGARLRLPLVELSHLADRSQGDLLALDLGTISGRKYIVGGWKNDWNPDLQQEGQESWFEANGKAARLFFKHKKDGFVRVTLRMRAVKKQNKVTVYLNDKSLGQVEIGPDWENHTLEVPRGLVREGENQLLLRMRSVTRQDKRNQSALVAAAWMLPEGASVEQAPRGPSVGALDLGGGARDALVAAAPQTWTYRMHVPGPAPRLALSFGARQAGATLKVSVRDDRGQSMDAELSAGQGWSQRVLDLETFQGQTVEVALQVGGAWEGGQVAGVADLALYSGVPSDGAQAARAPQTHAKNLLVYLIDTMRYDKFSFYNPKTTVHTPHIDAFAKDATVFENAYDNENWTKPSCATILSGVYPDTHKTKHDSSKLPERVVMVSEHLKTQGFRTGSFIANGYVSNAFGFRQGWDFHTNYIREYKNTNVDHVVEDTLKWIDGQKGQRFFAYVQTIDPHVPYSPPKEWREKYWDKPYRGPLRAQNTGNQLAEIKGGSMKLNSEDKEYLEALYNGEVAFNDHYFGELIKGLKERGLYEDTAILLISDHGEEFWDHGLVGHGHSLYEEMVHAPMIMRYPNKVPVGRRVPHVVHMVDVASSLYDLAGVPANDENEGISMLPTLDGVGQARPYMAVTDFLLGSKSFRAGRYKWITGGRDGKLYDVVGDRHEKKNLLKKAHIGQAHVRALAGIFLGADDKTAWWKGSKGRKRKVIEADSADIDADLRKQLESMGYIDGASAPSEGKKE